MNPFDKINVNLIRLLPLAASGVNCDRPVHHEIGSKIAFQKHNHYKWCDRRNPMKGTKDYICLPLSLGK